MNLSFPSSDDLKWNKNIVYEAQVGVCLTRSETFPPITSEKVAADIQCRILFFFTTAVKRLMREARELHEPTELYYAQPLEVRRCDHVAVAPKHLVVFTGTLLITTHSSILSVSISQ